MAEASAVPADGGKKSGLKLGLIGAVVMAALGFYAVWAGYVLAPAAPETEAAHDDGHGEADAHGPLSGPGVLPDVAFVPLDPMVISLPPGAGARMLRFRAELEVPAEKAAEVEHLKPRVVDVLNTYLRAVEPAELSRPGALVTLRHQMRRRVALVVGETRVADLLVMEFVLD